MNAVVQEFGGAMTCDQLQMMIAGRQEEDGDEGGKMYKDEGVGLGGTVKGRGAGLDRTVKDAGAGRQEQGHGSEDIDTSNSYLLADPRLVEVHDYGTLVPSTGSARSSVQPLAVDNPPYSQHLRGDTSEGKGEGGVGGPRLRTRGAASRTRARGVGGGTRPRRSGQGLVRRPRRGTSGTSRRRARSTRTAR